jgi:hypothetical protein
MPPQLKAQLLLARLEYLGSLTGPEVKARVLRCLPEEERERLRQLSGEAWVPFRLLMSLDHAIRSVLAPGDDTLFVELGRASARQRTEWLGEHAPLVSVHGFLSRVAEEHRRFHTFGRAEYQRLGFRHGQIAFYEFPEVDPAYCLSASGYLTAAIEMLGGARARVQEVICQCRGQGACRYDLRWDEKGAPAESQR